MADGRCVNVIVFRGPSLRARGRAAKFESVARMFVVKKREPSAPGAT